MAKPASATELAITLSFLALYLLSMLLTRWNHIAKSLHAMIEGQLLAVATRLETEIAAHQTPELLELRGDLKNLSDRWSARPAFGPRIMEFVFWSRGRENATWVEIHEIEQQMAMLVPSGQIDSYLRWAGAGIRGLDDPAAPAIAEAIRQSLESPAPADPIQRAEREEPRRALVDRAVGILYSDRDGKFSTLMEWQNKASWLVFVALLIIGFMGGVAGHGLFFLAGAAGGFLSRLMRTLQRDNVPLDYGASWTTLFLSPLFGALAGWFGLALVTLGTAPGVNLLGSAFTGIRWDPSNGVHSLAVAFMLGFSERFFDALVGAIEKHADSDGGRPKVPAPVGVPQTGGSGGAVVTTTPGPPISLAAAGTGGATQAMPGPQTQGRIGTLPSITSVTASAGGSSNLVVSGQAFQVGAVANVNAERRQFSVQSSSMAVLTLMPADQALLATKADFVIHIQNPDGGTSAPFNYRPS